MKPQLITPPATELLTLPEAKQHLRVVHADEDGLITSLAAAAEAYLDGWAGILGRCIRRQTWQSVAPCFSRHMRLPFIDVVSAVVTYLDADEAEQTLPGASYRVINDHKSGVLIIADAAEIPATAAREDAVRIAAVYGYATPPEAIKVAALMLVAQIYENREGGETLPKAAEALLRPFRRTTF